MDNLTKAQVEALIVLLEEKVESLYWYSGKCHECGDLAGQEKWAKSAWFWEDMLVGIKQGAKK